MQSGADDVEMNQFATSESCVAFETVTLFSGGINTLNEQRGGVRINRRASLFTLFPVVNFAISLFWLLVQFFPNTS